MDFRPKLRQTDVLQAHDAANLPSVHDDVCPAAQLGQGERAFVAGHTQATVDELLRIHEYERQRLGQELHDSTGQLVISLMLGLARLKRIEEDGGQVILIDEIQETVRQIDKEIRSLAFLHYQAELGDRSLVASIENLALGFGRRTGMHISFKCVGDLPPVDDSISTALLRVAQEALVNVHRHSRATAAKVDLKLRPTRIELRISDDGVGMPIGEMPRGSGIGLKGMRYRIEAHAGRFEIRSLNPGTMVCAIVPLGPQGLGLDQ